MGFICCPKNMTGIAIARSLEVKRWSDGFTVFSVIAIL